MKDRVCLLLSVLLIAGGFACTPTRVWVSDPAFTTAETGRYAVQFMPLTDDKNFIQQFRLLVTNRSDKELEVDWTATRYLFNSQPHGRFLFEGIDESNINNPPSDLVAAGETLMKVIAPVQLLAIKPARSSQFKDQPAFSSGPVPEGSNGIALALRQDGELIRVQLSVSVTIEVK
ncbi:MAG: hypothetical protein AMJ54_02800 [Deltaproteobacteria bacterium SG8_13]|nr:MAG: hypothetical protein AMJ54_02800 [Deltaproteobacteria bacterium SG8_13]